MRLRPSTLWSKSRHLLKPDPGRRAAGWGGASNTSRTTYPGRSRRHARLGARPFGRAFTCPSAGWKWHLRCRSDGRAPRRPVGQSAGVGRHENPDAAPAEDRSAGELLSFVQFPGVDDHLAAGRHVTQLLCDRRLFRYGGLFKLLGEQGYLPSTMSTTLDLSATFAAGHFLTPRFPAVADLVGAGIRPPPPKTSTIPRRWHSPTTGVQIYQTPSGRSTHGIGSAATGAGRGGGNEISQRRV
jgi:hypothetical protein